MNTINTRSNFIDFNQQLTKEFGNFYTSQTHIFFERAFLNTQKGLYLSAIEDCKFALSLNEFAAEKINTHYLIGYISQLYCDLGQTEKAWYYYEYGLSLLDHNQDNYTTDYRLYLNVKDYLALFIC